MRFLKWPVGTDVVFPIFEWTAKTRMRSTFDSAILTLLALAIVCACRPAETASSSDPSDEILSARLDSIGLHYIEQGQIMGLSMAVAKDGEVIYTGQFGYIDSTRSRPVQQDHYFLMASISKLITSVVVAKLVEEGKLSWDDTLADLLPAYPNQAQARQITIRHLASNTAGLKDYADVIDSTYLATGIDPVQQDYLDFFREHPLDFDPGSHFNYSNSGFALMAMIIERVTGQSLAAEVDRIINQPTGLDLRLIRERISDAKMTSAFELVDSVLEYRPHWPWIQGDGGLTATARDLVRFPFFWSDGSIITRSAFEEMCTPVVLEDGVITGYGLGVRTGRFEGAAVVGHTGGNKTGLSVMAYYPEKDISIVVLVNTDNVPTDALYIEGYVALAVLGIAAPDLATLEVADDQLSRFEGDYEATPSYYYGPGKLTLTIDAEDQHLYRKRMGSDAQGQKLYYLGDHTFGYEPYPMDRVVFQLDANGHVRGFNNYWNGLKKGGLYRKVN